MKICMVDAASGLTERELGAEERILGVRYGIGLEKCVWRAVSVSCEEMRAAIRAVNR
jgi:hypothetical protein